MKKNKSKLIKENKNFSKWWIKKIKNKDQIQVPVQVKSKIKNLQNLIFLKDKAKILLQVMWNQLKIKINLKWELILSFHKLKKKKDFMNKFQQ